MVLTTEQLAHLRASIARDRETGYLGAYTAGGVEDLLDTIDAANDTVAELRELLSNEAHKRKQFEFAFNEHLRKTEYIQENKCGRFDKMLGMHRDDCARIVIDRQSAEITNLYAELSRLRSSPAPMVCMTATELKKFVAENPGYSIPEAQNLLYVSPAPTQGVRFPDDFGPGSIHAETLAHELRQGAPTMGTVSWCSSFLRWVADRLVHVHEDPENADFVLRLREIAVRLTALKPGEVVVENSCNTCEHHNDCPERLGEPVGTPCRSWKFCPVRAAIRAQATTTEKETDNV
jgi:hypothetical protein